MDRQSGIYTYDFNLPKPVVCLHEFGGMPLPDGDGLMYSEESMADEWSCGEHFQNGNGQSMCRFYHMRVIHE